MTVSRIFRIFKAEGVGGLGKKGEKVKCISSPVIGPLAIYYYCLHNFWGTFKNKYV